VQFAARYHDGLTALARNVTCRLASPGGTLEIADAATGETLAAWPAASLFARPTLDEELRIGASGQPSGARLVVADRQQARAVRAALPSLTLQSRRERGQQVRLAALSTGALAVVVLAYLYGVPLLANRIVPLIPPSWERQLGEQAAHQMEASLAASGGMDLCDPDENSLANRAIARFGRAAIAGAGVPFDIDIRVVHNAIPNAFALPGGHVYYFSALLANTETPDEFAGVLAHEIGHVAHHHAMQQLLATAGTGLLVGFVLGDMTGISVAAGLGSALIDTRFSRDAEREADVYSSGVATRLDFDPAGLPDLLDRVASDDRFSSALALLSTHPLTAERRAALKRLAVDRSNLEPPFTAAEWRAIKVMCGGPPADGDIEKHGDKNGDTSGGP
jgi:Zn-dependent protease with chaperone function